ncbi:MAG TPA: DNA-processing protein DprA [Ignavibacteria bacterium]|nr:DNA-processing protein DprA [Ignavibacteria bacterium]
MNDSEKIRYVNFLMNVKNLGNNRIRNIVLRIPEPYDFFNCSPGDLKKVEGIDQSIVRNIFEAKQNISDHNTAADKLIRDAGNKNINILTLTDTDYPENLKRIYDSPAILYFKGNIKKIDRYSLSIVGTRNPTEYGKFTCENFTEKLSNLGIPLISGFARGIDSIVHRVCMKHRNLTYAVLGCGADIIYPYENRNLYNELIENGAVISEFPAGSKPEKLNFPRRNRIISGISLGSIIIESGIKGGSLLTADFAVDQNREVFAVPGYINSRQSDGTNEIIKRGQAKLITCIEDILTELEMKFKPFLDKNLVLRDERSLPDLRGLKETEKELYDKLPSEPTHIDMISEITGLSISDCLVILLSLEFMDLVRQLPGKNFIKA